MLRAASFALIARSIVSPVPPRNHLVLAIVVVPAVAVAWTWSVSWLTVDGGGGINTDIVVVLTLAFYAFAIPAIINLPRGRQRQHRRRLIVMRIFHEARAILFSSGCRGPHVVRTFRSITP